MKLYFIAVQNPDGTPGEKVAGPFASFPLAIEQLDGGQYGIVEVTIPAVEEWVL